MNRIIIKIIFLAFILITNVAMGGELIGNENLAQVSKSWDEFVSALRVGDMPSAYAKLSQESKRTTSYRDFCVDWHPIGIQYNAVLSNPNYSNFSIYGDIAAIKIGLDSDINTGNSNFLRIILEKDRDQWFVVSEKAQAQAISNASICGVLRDIVKESRVLNTAFKTGRGNFSEIKKELPRIFSSDRGRLALSNYTFELDLLRDGVLRATPNKVGVLGYEITEEGVLTKFEPNSRPKLTAEEVLAKREKERLAEKADRARLLEQRLAKSKASATKPVAHKRTQPRIIPAVANTTQSSLPEMPPEFPMDFKKVSTSKPNPTYKKKLQYLDSKEDFDLPEIDSIAPSVFKGQSLKTAEAEENAALGTQTMAGNESGIHTTAVDLNSEELLEELEMMIDNYEEVDTFNLSEEVND